MPEPQPKSSTRFAPDSTCAAASYSARVSGATPSNPGYRRARPVSTLISVVGHSQRPGLAQRGEHGDGLLRRLRRGVPGGVGQAQQRKVVDRGKVRAQLRGDLVIERQEQLADHGARLRDQLAAPRVLLVLEAD